MNVFDKMLRGGLADPSTLLGAILYAFVFGFLAWLIGRVLHLAVQRVLARDNNDHVDLMAVKFIAKLVRYCVYILAFISYAHFVPSLSGLGTASLTSISVITVIVGIAAQSTLGNLVAGISLFRRRANP